MADCWFGNYNALLIPSFWLTFISVLEDVNKAAFCLLSRLGLVEEFSLEEISENSVVCGEIIRENLPLLSFAEKFRETEEDVVCAVCLNSFEKDDEIRELCNCSHVFHGDCLDRWIDQRHDTCPLCRCALLPQRQTMLDVQPGGTLSLWVVDQISYLFGEDLMMLSA